MNAGVHALRKEPTLQLFLKCCQQTALFGIKCTEEASFPKVSPSSWAPHIQSFSQCFATKAWQLTPIQDNSEGPPQFHNWQEVAWDHFENMPQPNFSFFFFFPIFPFNLTPCPAPTEKFTGQQCASKSAFWETNLQHALIYEFQIDNK